MGEKYDGESKIKQRQGLQETLRGWLKRELADLSEEQERSDIMVTPVEL